MRKEKKCADSEYPLAMVHVYGVNSFAKRESRSVTLPALNRHERRMVRIAATVGQLAKEREKVRCRPWRLAALVETRLGRWSEWVEDNPFHEEDLSI